MNKKQLSERDICTKFITPSLRRAGWDELTQLREEVSFTKGRIIVRGKLVTRGNATDIASIPPTPCSSSSQVAIATVDILRRSDCGKTQYPDNATLAAYGRSESR